MSDQTIAVLVGAFVVIALRILDYFFPKGYMSKWTKRNSVKNEENRKQIDSE